MGIKKTVLAVVAMLVMMTATCFAQITKEDLNIGGVYIGQSMEEVKARFGEPIRIESTPGGFRQYKLTFSDGRSEIFIIPNNEKVCYVNISGDSKFLTSKSIGVGFTEDEIIKAYGEPSEELKAIGQKIPKSLVYRMDDNVGVLSFDIANDGTILSIGMSGR